MFHLSTTQSTMKTKKTTIQIILPIYKRITILKRCIESIRRIQEQPSPFIIRCLVVHSDLLDKQQISYFFDNKLNTSIGVPNKPLGNKMNKSYHFALNHINHCDYIMQLGSDDLISTNYLDDITMYIQRGFKFFGPDKILFVDSETKRSKLAFEPNIGAGRLIHRSLLEGRSEWFELKDSGMDNSMRRNIEKHCELTPFTQNINIATDQPLICDIKSKTNIWSFDQVSGDEVDYNDYIELFPELKKV